MPNLEKPEQLELFAVESTDLSWTEKLNDIYYDEIEPDEYGEEL